MEKTWTNYLHQFFFAFLYLNRFYHVKLILNQDGPGSHLTILLLHQERIYLIATIEKSFHSIVVSLILIIIFYFGNWTTVYSPYKQKKKITLTNILLKEVQCYSVLFDYIHVIQTEHLHPIYLYVGMIIEMS